MVSFHCFVLCRHTPSDCSFPCIWPCLHQGEIGYAGVLFCKQKYQGTETWEGVEQVVRGK